MLALYAASGKAVWTEAGDDSSPAGLVVARLDGTESRRVAAIEPGGAQFVSVVSDEQHAFYTTQAGELRVASLAVHTKPNGPTNDQPDQGSAGAGGAASANGADILLSGAGPHAKLAMDARSIYAATNDGSGSILAVPKPLGPAE